MILFSSATLAGAGGQQARTSKQTASLVLAVVIYVCPRAVSGS